MGILVFTAATCWMNRVKYVSLRSSDPYDLAYFHNAVFNVTQGRTDTYVLPWAWFDQTDHDGPSIFRTTHFSPMQILTLYGARRLETLMLFQSAMIAAGAVPLFLMARRRTGDHRLALLLSASWLLHPAILHMAFNDYRPVQLGMAAALFALWFHATQRPVAFGLSALVMLACRPEYLFLLALFGLMNIRLLPRGGRIRWIVAPVVMAALWAALTQAYHLEAYGRSWPVLGAQAARQGLDGVEALLPERLPVFLRITLLPGVLALAAPEILAAALPFVAGADTVSWPAFPHTNLQHLSPAMPAVFWAFAVGITGLWPRLEMRPRAASAARWLLLAIVLACFVPFGWGAFHAYLAGGIPPLEDIDRIDSRLPADATVMAPMSLSARLAAHTRLLVIQAIPWPGWTGLSDEQKHVVVGRVMPLCDLVATQDEPGPIDQLAEQSGRFEPAIVSGRYRLYLARASAPGSGDPDAALQKALAWERMTPIQRRWARIVPAH